MMVFLNTLKTASTLHILNTGVSTRRGSLLRGVGSNVRLPTRWPCDWIMCLSRGFGGWVGGLFELFVVLVVLSHSQLQLYGPDGKAEPVFGDRIL